MNTELHGTLDRLEDVVGGLRRTVSRLRIWMVCVIAAVILSTSAWVGVVVATRHEASLRSSRDCVVAVAVAQDRRDQILAALNVWGRAVVMAEPAGPDRTATLRAVADANAAARTELERQVDTDCP